MANVAAQLKFSPPTSSDPEINRQRPQQNFHLPLTISKISFERAWWEAFPSFRSSLICWISSVNFESLNQFSCRDDCLHSHEQRDRQQNRSNNKNWGRLAQIITTLLCGHYFYHFSASIHRCMMLNSSI